MKKPLLDKILDNTHTISYALYGAIGAFIIYRLIKNKQRTSEASFSSFAGTANNFFNSTFGGVTKGGTLLGSLPTNVTTTSGAGSNAGIPSQYQNILNALLNQYGQVKYKDCYNKFVAYAQSQGLTPSSSQWYPEMVSYMRRCLSGSTGTTAVNTETGTVTTGSSANPYQAELDGLMATYGVTKYRTCLSNWMNYAQLNGLTTQTTPNYYQTMFVFMQKCLQ